MGQKHKNILALALVMGMVWKMEKEVVTAINSHLAGKFRQIVTIDIVCVCKRLTDKSLILYTSNWERKALQRQQHFTRFWLINRNLAALLSKAEFCDSTRNVNKTHAK